MTKLRGEFICGSITNRNDFKAQKVIYLFCLYVALQSHTNNERVSSLSFCCPWTQRKLAMRERERERCTKGSWFILCLNYLFLSLFLSFYACAKTCIKDAARYGFVDDEERERVCVCVFVRERKRDRERRRPCLADLSSFASIQLQSLCLPELCLNYS